MHVRWLHVPIVAAVIGAGGPAAANNLYLGISYATDFTRECPEFVINMDLAMRIMAVVYGPPNNIPESFGEALMTAIPPVPPTGTPPYNPEDFPPSHGVEPIDCADGMTLFGPQGTLIPGLLAKADKPN